MSDRLSDDLGIARDRDRNWFTEHLLGVGLPQPVARRWGRWYGDNILLDERPTLNQTIAMHNAGVTPDDATEWYLWDVTYDDAALYARNGLTRYDAVNLWHSLGSNMQSLADWLDVDLPVERIVRLVAAGVTYDERHAWLVASDGTLEVMSALRNGRF